MISEQYRQQNAELHAARPDYGAGGARWAGLVSALCDFWGCKSVLDYGSGKGGLAKALQRQVPVAEYDPAVPGKDASAGRAELLVSTDVLEHIELEHLNAVLSDMHRCTDKLAFVSIATRPAQKTLPDGRNAHLIVEGVSWWRERLQKHFRVLTTRADGASVRFLLSPRAGSTSDMTPAST